MPLDPPVTTSVLIEASSHRLAGGYGARVRLEMSGEVVHWRGPSPYHFVPVPAEAAETIAEVAAAVSYGWGVIPVRAELGDTVFTTSLFPKDGGYLVPLKDAVRRAEAVQLGDIVALVLHLDL